MDIQTPCSCHVWHTTKDFRTTMPRPMNGPALTELHAAQARRLLARLTHALAEPMDGAWPLRVIGRELHLLKGAALAAGDQRLARLCHEAETALVSDDPAAFQALLEMIARHVERLPAPGQAPDIAQLRQGLREGFLALRRLTDVEAVLRLDIDEGWLRHRDVLQDILPQLLRNALAHGGQAPHERIAAGRPARLTIVVRAICGPRRWRVLVADDGCGMARASGGSDLMSGRGWGVAAVQTVLAELPDARMRYRGREGCGSCVRISCAAPETDAPRTT